MGLLINGQWVNQWYDTKKTDGRFIRKSSAFRYFIGSQRFPVEENRYHLYISHACPWAHRTTIFRMIKGLESTISVTLVNPFMGENGWAFDEDNTDLINKKDYLHEIYTCADSDYTGRVTVPLLWDKKERTIVNNESSDIIRMFNSEFNHLTSNLQDFYPERFRHEIDEINDFIYRTINNGVYTVGFATTQSVYEEELKTLFDALDHLEKRLETQRFLIGNQLTESDIRLFTTLVRFDPVYFGHFKCNIKRIIDYPNLSEYVRDIYQRKSIEETVHMDHIKTHYYTSHPFINPTQIVPVGPLLDYTSPHNRDRFIQ